MSFRDAVFIKHCFDKDELNFNAEIQSSALPQKLCETLHSRRPLRFYKNFLLMIYANQGIFASIYFSLLRWMLVSDI